MTTLIFLRSGSALVLHGFAARYSVCSRSSVENQETAFSLKINWSACRFVQERSWAGLLGCFFFLSCTNMLNSCLNTTGFPTLFFWHLPSLEEFSLFAYRRYVLQIYQFSNAGVNAALSTARTAFITPHGFVYDWQFALLYYLQLELLS